jgi:16S rRNA (guanine527-N7)-methyltransferase
MDSARINALLAPFLPVPLTLPQLDAVAAYLDLLLRWNARMNLTAVRDPESIITRHFGESLFTAATLFSADASASARVLDVGSGAGFPGLPLKIYCPQIRLTLIESQHKKATFLKEAIRTLRLDGVDVFCGRAEQFPTPTGATVVTLRAVERFEQVLPVAASLLGESSSAGGRLALLIGAAQAPIARDLLPNFRWNDPVSVPESANRVILVGCAKE